MEGLRTRTPPGRTRRLSTSDLVILFRDAVIESRQGDWRAPTARGVARRINLLSGAPYDVDYLVKRLRPLLSKCDRSLPARRGLKSASDPFEGDMSSPPANTRRELDAAIRSKDLSAVRRLLERDPALARSRNKEEPSPLMVAVYCGAADIARDLASRGPTDLFEATCLGDVSRVDDLLSRDPGLVDSYSSDGWTALHLAAHFAQPEVARLLLSHGARVGAVSRNGIANQPLQAAIAGRAPQLVAILLSAGADANHRSHGGFTAAHLAAENGSLEMLEMLRAAKADLGAQAEGGKTPLDLAKEGHHDAVVTWLRAH